MNVLNKRDLINIAFVITALVALELGFSYVGWGLLGLGFGGFLR